MPLEFTNVTAHDWESSKRSSKEFSLDISDNPTWRALDSPYRMRLFEMIRRSDGLTINELAKLANTNPVNLYYHIRTLEGHKLIRSSGHRENVARRAPVVYAAAVHEIVIQYNPKSKVDLERILHLRKTWIREAENSLERSASFTQDDDPSLFRWETLSDSQYEELRRHLERVSAILEESRANPKNDQKNCSLHYVGFQIAKVPEDTLPVPRIMLYAEETIQAGTARSDLELIESKMPA
jgi:predicted transcriptional regulator